jgi:exonuclease VII small subunit
MQQPVSRIQVILKEYNEVLINKLEQKMLSLEQANQALEAEITARKQAEEELRKSQLITENIPTGLYIYHLEDLSDDRRCACVCQPVSQDLTGLGPVRVRRQKLDDENFPAPGHRAYRSRYAEVVRTRAPITLRGHNLWRCRLHWPHSL